MHVEFQVIHTFDKISELTLLIEKLIQPINDKIISGCSVYNTDSEYMPISVYTTYNYKNEGKKQTITGIDFSYYAFCLDYDEDFEYAIDLGFEGGAGEALNKMNDYIYDFANNLRNNDKIIQILKLFDANMRSAYKMISEELYEIEMKIRKILNFILFKENHSDMEVKKIIKNSINPKNRLNIDPDNYENELFLLNFVEYQNLLTNSSHKEFLKGIEEPLKIIRLFRNCIMHNREFNTVTHPEYCEAKEQLELIINNFWENQNESNINEKVPN